MVRVKHRYFVLEVRSSNKRQQEDSICKDIREKHLYFEIMSNVRHLHGDFGEVAVAPAMNLKYVNRQTGLMILRSRLGPHRLLASALPLVKRVSDVNQPISISTLYIGACIKHCLLFIKKYQMDEYLKVAMTLNQEDREKLKNSYMDITLFGEI